MQAPMLVNTKLFAPQTYPVSDVDFWAPPNSRLRWGLDDRVFLGFVAQAEKGVDMFSNFDR